MALAAGTRVGPYEVLELLGAGGMGEVYRAHDPRLGRQVAIKVLPERFAHSEDRLARFEREARAAGALNHPNVLTVFDVGSEEGIHHLVCELLEGETLQALLRVQRLGVRQSLALALEAARGLACTHEAGILHRDLKPANLFLTRDGRLKILDFGLAKLVHPASGSLPGARTATRDTEAGRVPGTAAYMSPEQIRDEPLDARCDLFALGAILYEMIARRTPFTGATESDVMAAVLRDDPPPLASTGSGVPAAVEALVRRCLEKRRDDRFRSAGELMGALEMLIASLASGDRTADTGEVRRSSPAAKTTPFRRRLALFALAAGSIAVSALSAAVLLRPTPKSPPAPPLETVPITSNPGRELEPALARDGQRVAFAWNGDEGDNFDLYTKVIGAETALRLTSHRGYDGSPAWSPDGRWIAFIRVDGGRGTVLLVPSTGGAERKLLDLDPWYGSSISFSPDGRWIALSERPAPGAAFGVVLVEVDSRATQVVTRPDHTVAGDAFPAFSPDGSSIAFARFPARGAALHWAVVSVVPAAGGDITALAREDQVIGGLDWTRDGREVVFSASRGYEGPLLWRVPATGGPQVRVAGQDVPMSNLFGAETITQMGRYYRISVAADRIAYAQSQYQTDIWSLEVGPPGRAAARPLVVSTQVDDAPQFSPDGSRIAFSSARATKHPQIWICNAGGDGCAQLTSFKSACGTPRWSPDGKSVAFDAGEAGQSDVYVSDATTGVSRRVTFHDASDVIPSWSRDGASIYFASDRSGAFQIWRMSSAGGPATAVTENGGFAAFESPDGREVYFTRYSRPGLWSVPTEGGPDRVILDGPPCWGYWALWRRGVYVLDPNGPRGHRIGLHRWGSAGLEHVADVPAAPACGESGLSLSPDERTLLYVGAVRTSDIVMLDGFR